MQAGVVMFPGLESDQINTGMAWEPRTCSIWLMWNRCWMISCILCMCAALSRRQFCRCCRLRHIATVTRFQNWRSGGARGASAGADISGWQYSRPFAFGSCIKIAAVTVICGTQAASKIDGGFGQAICCA